MVKVEICINSDTLPNIRQAVAAAYQGGAATVELCSAMHLDGLTPPAEHIRAARQAFGERAGLMVMIRPRGGDFNYSKQELDSMQAQIRMAAEAGADGAVFGVLTTDGSVASEALRALIEIARGLGLKTTFHRAFDASRDPYASLETLAELGVDRVLTSGLPWGQKGSALDGIERLGRVIAQARGRLEIVISGGVNPANVTGILAGLPLENRPVSVHAYSGAQENGQTTLAAVQALIDAANPPPV